MSFEKPTALKYTELAKFSGRPLPSDMDLGNLRKLHRRIGNEPRSCFYKDSGD